MTTTSGIIRKPGRVPVTAPRTVDEPTDQDYTDAATIRANIERSTNKARADRLKRTRGRKSFWAL